MGILDRWVQTLRWKDNEPEPDTDEADTDADNFEK